MGLSTIITPFYKQLSAQTFKQYPTLGQLAWVPVPAYPPIPQILDVARDDPRGHQSAQSRIRNVTQSDFKKRQGLPVFKLQLADHEELMIQKAKRRLAIIVSLQGTTFGDVDPILRNAGKKHLQERNVLVAPLYGIQSDEHPNGFPEIMRHRIDALLYGQFFFCPRNSSPSVDDSVARLDRLFPVVPQDPAAYDPLPVALADEALSVLLALLRLRFGSKSEPEIDTIREITADTIPVEFRLAQQPAVPVPR
jgi:hypothetical protein